MINRLIRGNLMDCPGFKFYVVDLTSIGSVKNIDFLVEEVYGSSVDFQ